MAIMNIDFPLGIFPEGFSEKLKKGFNILTIDMYATPNFTDEYIMEFSSEESYFSKKLDKIKHVDYRELGRFELLEGLYVEGEYINSFFIAKNEILNEKKGRNDKLAVLLYVEKNNFYIWYPWFEELFLPLIEDDIKNKTDKHLRNLKAIQIDCHEDFDIGILVKESHVDYEIEHSITEGFHTGVYYSLLKHIFLMEDEKYPSIPGSKRTIQAYEELFKNFSEGDTNLDGWRSKFHLNNPWE